MASRNGTNGKDVSAAIKAMANTTPNGGNLKAAHLGNLAVNALKYLVLHAESDDLRYHAAQSLLQLPAVQKKLQASASVVKMPPVDQLLERRIRKLVEGGSKDMLALIEQAEKDAAVQSESGTLPANTVKTKETP